MRSGYYSNQWLYYVLRFWSSQIDYLFVAYRREESHFVLSATWHCIRRGNVCVMDRLCIGAIGRCYSFYGVSLMLRRFAVICPSRPTVTEKQHFGEH